jgi:DNA-binding NarL/FixJ family response regulator
MMSLEKTKLKDKEAIETARIMLVEDHASFRQSMAYMLEDEPGFEVVAQAGSLAEARKNMRAVDVAVLDFALPDGEGIELIADLQEIKEHTMVLVLSGSISRRQYARAVEAGASGVLHKTADIGEIVDAIKRLNRGETLLSVGEVVEIFRLANQQRERNREALEAIESLSKREKEILRALARGLDSKAIARELYIAEATERSHFLRIFGKLGVHSRLQALVFAVRHGIVEIE